MSPLTVRFLDLLRFPRRSEPCDQCKVTKLVWLIPAYRSLYCSACLAKHPTLNVMGAFTTNCRLCGHQVPRSRNGAMYLPTECMEENWTFAMAHVHRTCLQKVMSDPDLDAMTALVEA